MIARLVDYMSQIIPIFINAISKYKTLTIAPKDKAAFIDSLQGSDVRVIDVYKENKRNYVNSISKGIWKTIAVSGVIVFVSLIEIYLMLRASFLSRIKGGRCSQSHRSQKGRYLQNVYR